MAVLLIAEHDNKVLKGRDEQGAHSGVADGRRRPCAGGRQQGRCRCSPGCEALGRPRKSCTLKATRSTVLSPNPWRLSSSRSRCLRSPRGRGDDQRQELHAAGRRPTRSDADLRYLGREIGRHLRPFDLRRQRRSDRAVNRRQRRSSPCAPPPSRQPAKAVPLQSRR